MKAHHGKLFAVGKTSSQIGTAPNYWIFILILLAFGGSSFAQMTLMAQAQSAGGTPTAGAPITITLQDALQRARLNDPQSRSAITHLRLPRKDRVQARASLLPNVNYNNSFTYTQVTAPMPANCAASTREAT